MGFLYDVLQLSAESLNNSDLYNMDCIHNFNFSVNYITFTVNQDTQNYSQIPRTHNAFLPFEFGDVPHKTTKPINRKCLSYS